MTMSLENDKMFIKSLRVDQPRPLKISSSISSSSGNLDVTNKAIKDVFADLQSLYVGLSNFNYDETMPADISRLCGILKMRGSELDVADRVIMDRYFVAIRNVAREDRLDMISRFKLLEVIEMRSMKWNTNENIVRYYKQKIQELEQGTERVSTTNMPSIVHNYASLLPTQSSTSNVVPLAPGEVIRSSGKFAKPTKIAGKNYFKDEVIIRNSDSGKVTPGARDRLVQITGPNEEAISHAKTLVEDTIRKNALPMVDKEHYDANEQEEFLPKKLAHSLSMTDASVGEYLCKLKIGANTLTLSSANSDLVTMSKIVLEEYYMDNKEQSIQSVNYQNFRNGDTDREPMRWTRSWRNSESRVSVSLSGSSDDDDAFRDPKQQATKPGSDVATVKAPIPRSNSTQHSNFNQIATDMPALRFPAFDRSISLPCGTSNVESTPPISPPQPKKISYSKDELMKISENPMSKVKPPFLLNEPPAGTYQYIRRNRYIAPRYSV